MIKSIRHFGIKVYDLAGSVEYLKKMGAVVVDAGKCDVEFTKEAVGVDAAVNWVKLRFPDSDTLELIEFDPPSVGNLCHIAVTTDDMGDLGPGIPAIDEKGRYVKYVRRGELVFEMVKEAS